MNISSPSIDYAARLQALRDEVRKQKLDGFLAPVADEYQSEALPPSARRVEFLTGFTGSAGLVVLTADKLLGKAAFFTDGRYTLQASQQLPKELYEIFDSVRKSPADWLKDNARPGFQIGFDPLLHTAGAIERMQKTLERTGIDVVPVKTNPIDTLWPDRPAPPFAPVYAYEMRYAGQNPEEKRRLIAETMTKDGIQAALITDAASIAWLLNVRGGDLPYSPLALSVAILRADAALEWFIDPRKITAGLDGFLGPNVTRYTMDDLPAALRRLGETRNRVRVDPSETSFWIMAMLGKAGALIDRGEDPCALPKACKNAAELEGMRAAHRRDGAALANFLCWLDANAESGHVTELSAEEKLFEFRSVLPLFKGPSFATIAGAGPHGAVVHYRATQETNRTLDKDSLFLIDSGGQYLDGTTDVTRTVAIGTPTPEMRDRFTRVLKGHIALASIVFPEGTTGAELEVLARQFLWAAGLDYSHSTGHGVGSYLNVHEGPQSISRKGQTALKPGMVLSNEPGFYKANHYGIRIENIQAVVERIDLNTAEHKMLAFEPLTLVPIDHRLIVADLLLPAEREWLNAYHARVKQAIRPLVSNGTLEWLERATEEMKA